MKIETTTRDDHQAQVTAEFDADTLEKFMRRAARKISADTKIPGFRPGKAPYDVVRRQYGDDAIRQQAVELMLDEVYPQVLEEAGIKPSGPGQLENIVSYDPPVFTFVIPLEPVVELGDYRAIHRDYELQPVTEEQVEEVIKNLQRRSATAEPVERPIEEGDLVYLKLKADFAEPETDEDPVFIKETPYQVVVGEDDSGENSWPFPRFSRHLVGLSANDERLIPYTYPEDSEFEKLRNRTVNFTVTVQSVKLLQLPELNDEFAQSVGEFETVAALREQIQAQLEQNNQSEYDDEYLSAVIDEIIAGASIKYPPDMLAEEEKHLLEHMQEDLAKQRLDLDTYLKSREMDQDTFIEQEVRPSAVKRLQRQLILNELSQAEDIHLDPELLERTVQRRLFELSGSDYFKKKPTQAELRNIANALTYDSANRLMNERILSRIKSIASGIPEEEAKPVEEEIPAADETAVEEEPVLHAGEEALAVMQSVESETAAEEQEPEVAAGEEVSGGEETPDSGIPNGADEEK